MASHKHRELVTFVKRLFLRACGDPPDHIPVQSIPEDIATLPDRFAFTVPSHSRSDTGEVYEMTFVKLGTQDGMYPHIFMFCSCSPEGAPFTPTIRLSTTPDRQPDEHNIPAPVTLTTEGILYNSEVTEEGGWFSPIRENLNLPDIPLSKIEQNVMEVAECDMDNPSHEALTDRLADLLYKVFRCFPG